MMTLILAFHMGISNLILAKGNCIKRQQLTKSLQWQYLLRRRIRLIQGAHKVLISKVKQKTDLSYLFDQVAENLFLAVAWS